MGRKEANKMNHPIYRFGASQAVFAPESQNAQPMQNLQSVQPAQPAQAAQAARNGNPQTGGMPGAGLEDSACRRACSEEDVLYYGQATQNVPANATLILTRYAPAGSAEPQNAVTLPMGRYLITYAANASAMDAGCPLSDPTCTVTVGLAPWINRANFPRGGSFATLRAEGSAALGSTFVVTLPNEQNAIGFYNPGPLDTNYQLLNVTITRVG